MCRYSATRTPAPCQPGRGGQLVEEGETHDCRTPAGGASTGADAGGAGLADGAGACCANCVEGNRGAYCVEGKCEGDCVRY